MPKSMRDPLILPTVHSGQPGAHLGKTHFSKIGWNDFFRNLHKILSQLKKKLKDFFGFMAILGHFQSQKTSKNVQFSFFPCQSPKMAINRPKNDFFAKFLKEFSVWVQFF